MKWLRFKVIDARTDNPEVLEFFISFTPSIFSTLGVASEFNMWKTMRNTKIESPTKNNILKIKNIYKHQNNPILKQSCSIPLPISSRNFITTFGRFANELQFILCETDKPLKSNKTVSIRNWEEAIMDLNSSMKRGEVVEAPDLESAKLLYEIN